MHYSSLAVYSSCNYSGIPRDDSRKEHQRSCGKKIGHFPHALQSRQQMVLMETC
jgi:hypothetical protein